MSEIPEGIDIPADIRALAEKTWLAALENGTPDAALIIGLAILAERQRSLNVSIEICDERDAPCCAQEDWTDEQKHFFDQGQKQACTYLAMRFLQILERGFPNEE